MTRTESQRPLLLGLFYVLEGGNAVARKGDSKKTVLHMNVGLDRALAKAVDSSASRTRT